MAIELLYQRLYSCAAQSESFVMSAFYNGLLRTMKANYVIGCAFPRVLMVQVVMSVCVALVD